MLCEYRIANPVDMPGMSGSSRSILIMVLTMEYFIGICFSSVTDSILYPPSKTDRARIELRPRNEIRGEREGAVVVIAESESGSKRF